MTQPLATVESIDTITAVFRAAPGTEQLYDLGDEKGDQARRLEGLQHVKKGDGHILLVPQPSLTDPNDPLLWPAWKKWITFSNALSYSFLGAVTGPIMAAGKHVELVLKEPSTNVSRDGAVVRSIQCSVPDNYLCERCNLGPPGSVYHRLDVSSCSSRL